MKNNNRKKQSTVDCVIQREHHTEHTAKKRKVNSSNSSSDFSDFKLNGKRKTNANDDDDEDFSPFIKPKCWKHHKKSSEIKQKASNKETNIIHKNEEKHGKRRRKKSNNKKQNDNHDNSDPMKNHNQPSAFHQSATKKQSNEQQNKQQSLIAEYDKAEFNKKQIRIKWENEHKGQQKSPNRNSNVEGGCSGMVQTKGGVCFEVNTKDFFCEATKNQQSKGGRRRERKAQRSEYLHSNQEILKRRDTAFRYGEMIRLRTFGCH